MSKYVLELRPNCRMVQQICEADGKVYVCSTGVRYLEELTSDYINEHFGQLQDDAYERGHGVGYQKGYKACKMRYCSFEQAEYQRGLDDAWEAAKKIALMDTETSENVTGYFGLFRIMENLTPMQAIEKLKAYEEKKSEDEIKVGDEVTPKRTSGWKGVVFGIHDDAAMVLTSDGYSAMYRIETLCKTGRHFDISTISILEDMRND